jgi:hypothetical protein
MLCLSACAPYAAYSASTLAKLLDFIVLEAMKDGYGAPPPARELLRCCVTMRRGPWRWCWRWRCATFFLFFLRHGSQTSQRAERLAATCE